MMGSPTHISYFPDNAVSLLYAFVLWAFTNYWTALDPFLLQFGWLYKTNTRLYTWIPIMDIFDIHNNNLKYRVKWHCFITCLKHTHYLLSIYIVVEMIGVKNRAYCSLLAEIAKTCVLLGLVKYFKKMRGNGLPGSCFPSCSQKNHPTPGLEKIVRV